METDQYNHSRSFLHVLMVYIYSELKLKCEDSSPDISITVSLSESRPHVEKTQSILFHVPHSQKSGNNDSLDVLLFNHSSVHGVSITPSLRSWFIGRFGKYFSSIHKRACQDSVIVKKWRAKNEL